MAVLQTSAVEGVRFAIRPLSRDELLHEIGDLLIIQGILAKRSRRERDEDPPRREDRSRLV